MVKFVGGGRVGGVHRCIIKESFVVSWMGQGA